MMTECDHLQPLPSRERYFPLGMDGLDECGFNLLGEKEDDLGLDGIRVKILVGLNRRGIIRTTRQFRFACTTEVSGYYLVYVTEGFHKGKVLPYSGKEIEETPWRLPQST